MLPKGHIKPGETPEDTALREIKEETGIKGEIVTKLTKEYFEKENEKVYVQYFLIKKIKKNNPKENREVKWLIEESALQLLSFEGSRNILKKAVNFLKKPRGLI